MERTLSRVFSPSCVCVAGAAREWIRHVGIALSVPTDATDPPSVPTDATDPPSVPTDATDPLSMPTDTTDSLMICATCHVLWEWSERGPSAPCEQLYRAFCRRRRDLRALRLSLRRSRSNIGLLSDRSQRPGPL
eukprot:363216-Chlamydomonas_euryale.AAC.4